MYRRHAAVVSGRRSRTLNTARVHQTDLDTLEKPWERDAKDYQEVKRTLVSAKILNRDEDLTHRAISYQKSLEISRTSHTTRPREIRPVIKRFRLITANKIKPARV